jgi:COMPASS component SWD1
MMHERDMMVLKYSNIILALMSTGEAYLADLRKEHRSRVELCEVQEESDDEAQPSRSRYVNSI